MHYFNDEFHIAYLTTKQVWSLLQKGFIFQESKFFKQY